MNDPTATSDLKLKRLNAALEHAGAVRGVRNKHVAEATGYTEGSVRGILSGNAALSDRFIKAVCSKFGISLEWVEEGKEPVFDWRPNPRGNGRIYYRVPKIAGVDLQDAKAPAIAQPIAGMPYPYKIAGPEASVPGLAGPLIVGSQPVSPLKDIIDKIKRYFIDCGDSELVASSASVAFLGIAALPNHELIDFSYQLRKLNDGDSDKVATLAADEMFERLGIKPTTRIKLERIPVEPEEEKQEK